MTGFHVQDGLCFEREENGDVKVSVVHGGYQGLQKETEIFTTTINEYSWASVMNHVSCEDIDSSRQMRARHFHMGDCFTELQNEIVTIDEHGNA